MEKAKHVRAQRTDVVNIEDSERQVQRAFVIRATTFGLQHPGTRKAQENLLKCYFALGKSDDVKVLRDAPQVHLAHLTAVLQRFDEDVSSCFRSVRDVFLRLTGGVPKMWTH